MKKITFLLVAAFVVMAANARILRVSNVPGSSAPFTTLEDAHNAAVDGDTLMFDASDKYYTPSGFHITKRLVLIGPGHHLVKNGIVEEGMETAKINLFYVEGEGTVIEGMTIDNTIWIKAPKVVIKRCDVNTISFFYGADNGVVTQNIIHDGCGGGSGDSRVYYTKITNNIFTCTGYDTPLSGFANGYIAYNTFRSRIDVLRIGSTTFEKNIYSSVSNADNSSNTFVNNYETSIIAEKMANNAGSFTDIDYYNIDLPTGVKSTYGAFAGETPYVLSGVPSGPVIIDLDVPTTVEMGSKLNVTLKIGVQK